MKKTQEPTRGGGIVDTRSIARVKSPARSVGSLRDGGVHKIERAPATKKTKATDANLRDGGAKLRNRSRTK